MQWISLAIAALAATATIAIAAGMEPRTLPHPTEDPFYNVPSNVDSYDNGQVIMSRRVSTSIGTMENVASHQVLYRTTNTQNHASATVATIWTPSKPVSPPKILSYQLYMDATQLNCAPSYAFLSGIHNTEKATTILDTPIVISWALKHGFYVVSPDHEGPRSAFIAGYEEGRAILDGVRALKNFKELPENSAVGFYGYSGGGHATAWAASLSGGYAPELNIIGAAYGGVPTSTRMIADFLNGKSVFSGFALAGISGLARAYPEMEAFILPRLNAEGQKTFERIGSRGECIAQVAFGYPHLDFYTLVNDTNMMSEEPIKSILSVETLLKSEASYTVPVRKWPRYIWHALEDEIVPFAPASQYVKEQCAEGADINWNVLPVQEHVSAEVTGIAPAIAWLSEAFQGKAPKVPCGAGNLPVAPSVKEVLGDDLVNHLHNLAGQVKAHL
ncbi:Lipase, secreted [Kalmanozyma brasiliensis GHG001]|uniref:Lipase n=1 Tax=Kalmanozyma brasiliensis (strain GHG001) TaxID=1365824 RepID=V5F249_KALBG|nr:Lipase, secreted [Kalmanozyma brasiliensis GHG001]EST09449.1 Lipase, secreted [Kalmanozyma brasiliensis GHG001]